MHDEVKQRHPAEYQDRPHDVRTTAIKRPKKQERRAQGHEQEEQRWSSERDPIQLLGKILIERKIADAARLEAILADVKAEIAKGVEFAIAAPYPPVKQVSEDVYA